MPKLYIQFLERGSTSGIRSRLLGEEILIDDIDNLSNEERAAILIQSRTKYFLKII